MTNGYHIPKEGVVNNRTGLCLVGLPGDEPGIV